tara:strand:+ start:16396 stop:16758 length:363 start_codon:yes stop_codon:yes gene_type:complete
MSTKNKDCEKTDVLGKLEKAADSLESASSQLSAAVTQQQLDLVKERVSICESDLVVSKEGLEVLAQRSAVHAEEADAGHTQLNEIMQSMEKDFAGLRALALTAFTLATISIVGLIISVVL